MTRVRSKRFLGVPDEFWIAFVIMVGFFLKLIFVIKTGWMKGTLNLGVWADPLTDDSFARGGHLAVLQYYFTRHLLPNVSPRTAVCFSNPPLYYITSSLFLEIFNRLLGWSVSISLHLVQCMNVLYVMIGECCGIGILRKYGIHGRKMAVSVLFLLFFPTFYNLSAALDGSAMCFMYMMLTLNSSVNWYMSRRTKSLRSAAVSAGLGLMTSPAAAIVLPPVIYLIRKGAVDGRRNEIPVTEQAKMFAAITAVLGLWWQVYMVIRFRVPPFFVNTDAAVPVTGTAASRLGIPSLSMLTHLHTEGVSALESNIPAQTLKTAAVDYAAVDLTHRMTVWITLLLILLVFVIFVLQHLMLIYELISLRIEHVYAMFLLIGELTGVVGYVAVCFLLPYTEFMNFRMIAPLMIFPLVGMGLCGGESSDGRFERTATAVVHPVIFVMSLVTAFLYGYYIA